MSSSAMSRMTPPSRSTCRPSCDRKVSACHSCEGSDGVHSPSSRTSIPLSLFATLHTSSASCWTSLSSFISYIPPPFASRLSSRLFSSFRFASPHARADSHTLFLEPPIPPRRERPHSTLSSCYLATSCASAGMISHYLLPLMLYMTHTFASLHYIIAIAPQCGVMRSLSLNE
jgi:hypothetical protein